MATSIKGFLIELYQEYLQEASILYGQRLNLFHDPEIYWQDLAEFESRFEAHIDGLIVGGDLALEVCKKQACEGDFGELHAAVRVFCRQDRKDFVLEVLEQLDTDDKEKTEAVCDALIYELPDSWKDEFVGKISSGPNKHVPLLARFIGYRRLEVGKELHQVLWQKKYDSPRMICWALGRLRERSAEDMLIQLLQSGDEFVSFNAALALLRIAQFQPADRFISFADSQQWPYIPIGLGAGRSALSALLKIAQDGKGGDDCLIALGLLGEISAIEVLLSKINDKELVESAVVALNLITGAEIYEKVFIPEEMEEDELFEEELENHRQGQVPIRLDGKPYGSTLLRLSQKQDEWINWWAGNLSRFTSGIRYRNGKLFSPSSLIESLEHEKSTYKVRQLAYEELVIRYDVDFPFEADMFVARQKQVLNDISLWINSNAGRFKDGAWYFAGKQIS